MAFIHSSSLEWHEGEQKMHSLLHVPNQDNPTSPFLTPGAAYLLQAAPLLAVGTLDSLSRPWTTLWGGEPGFARSLGSSIIGIKTLVDQQYDPVVEALVGGRQDEEVVKEEGSGRVVGGLAIDLASRRRVKLSGRMVAGAVGQLGEGRKADSPSVGEIQLVIKVEQSLGNCPKYLNEKQIIPALPEPELVSDSLPLPEAAVKLFAKADLFFVSSSDHGSNMGTNHRGGPPGFVRLVSNDTLAVTIAFPEYSGNRLYQTLGNLQTTPKAGFIIPDFDTRDVHYFTGTTEIYVGRDAADLLPRSNLAVKVHVVAARFVRRGLAFRGEVGEPSPYNPPVRLLAAERVIPGTSALDRHTSYATMLKKEMLTPAIARFRFSITNPEIVGQWTPGQHVILAFEDETGMGYSHMRDDDPKSLNDDYNRSWTISSPRIKDLLKHEFEITIRKVGTVTNFMFQQHERTALEIPLLGFGGNFKIEQREGEIVPFVAGGIGITPLLGQLSDLDLTRIRLFWTINVKDIGLVEDTFTRSPQALAPYATIFVSGLDRETREMSKQLVVLQDAGAHIIGRRLVAMDLTREPNLSNRWYICTAPSLRKSLLEWLHGKEVVYEDFDY